MMDKRIAKLPKWAQDIIKKLVRERKEAVDVLNGFCDTQTKTPFFFREMLSTGEKQGLSFKEKYIQTCEINIKHCGVFFQARLGRDGIKLSWENEKRHMEQVAFIPQSFQQAELIAKDNMRN